MRRERRRPDQTHAKSYMRTVCRQGLMPAIPEVPSQGFLLFFLPEEAFLSRDAYVSFDATAPPPQIGSKGLEIKVDNPESYNFRPKEMLREICTTISQFSTQPGFHKVRRGAVRCGAVGDPSP